MPASLSPSGAGRSALSRLIEVIAVRRDEVHRNVQGEPRIASRHVEPALTLFFFHLRTPAGIEDDDLGIDLPDLERAYLEAYRAIPEMAADFIRRGTDPMAHAFVIADAAGTVLMELPFTEAVRARPRPKQDRVAHSRRLSDEISAEVARAREAVQRSRAILARVRVPQSPFDPHPYPGTT